MSVVSAAFTRFSFLFSLPSVPFFISVFLSQHRSLRLPVYSRLLSALRVSYINAKFSSAACTSSQNAVAYAYRLIVIFFPKEKVTSGLRKSPSCLYVTLFKLFIQLTDFHKISVGLHFFSDF
jgi:hypothetical protein